MGKWSLFIVCMVLPFQTVAQESLHHDFNVTIEPDDAFIGVEDTVHLSRKLAGQNEITFLLHGALALNSVSGDGQARRYTIAKEGMTMQGVPWKQYTVALQGPTEKLTVHYEGRLGHAIERSVEESARNFSGTPGLIDSEGVFLANSTLWYPRVGEELVSFSLNVTLPAEWDAVSHGERTLHTTENERRIVRWNESNPQDDLYLVAGRYHEYSQAAGAAQAMVFLRQPDTALAQKYLDTTAQYLTMYGKLLGPYPYAKFALVENFWDTGYGMPSFTLLGPRVIRFPFILHSSYPHEILHNWWGNGVFVDYETGNWAEGLTAYLADHLVKEQRGQAANERRSVLQKYADYVSEGRDFPLTEFRSRHSSATEAVGYGKTLMVFHMLRHQLGDEVFVRGLRRFYRDYGFKRATFADLEQTFSQVADTDLVSFFNQWVARTGAPALRVSDATATASQGGFRLRARLEQIQNGKAYALQVPIAVHLEGQRDAFQTVVTMNEKTAEVVLEVPARPVRLDIDPEFDLFRRVDSAEIPSALSQGFGGEEVLVLLPKDADDNVKRELERLGRSWQASQAGQWEIKFDDEVKALPADRTVWLLGWTNRFRDVVQNALTGQPIEVSADRVTMEGRHFTPDNFSVVLTARNPSNATQTLVWLAADQTAAMPGLGRKLPHYRKYSYLAFEGNEPTNVAKGQWPVITSPMTVAVTQADGSEPSVTVAGLAPRQALAQLPPVFSEARMMKDIEVLAGETMAGRGLGSAELDDAAQYIAEVFRSAGLHPGGDGGESFYQTWSEDMGEPVGTVKLRNVVGVLPGSNPAYSGQSLVIGAHYDHLGLGWPDVRAGDEGKIHYGADDNASGVAVILELVRLLGRNWQPERSVVFVAFTGEEANRTGSLHYVNNGRQYPIDKVFAMINLDTVGRLGSHDLTVFGIGSAREWVHIFRGAGFVTGIGVKPVSNDAGFSDQKSFLEKGIPAVQLFGSVHTDFHRPSDTIDKIDGAGLVKTASILKEAAEYLAARAEPLTATLTSSQRSASTQRRPGSGRRVSIGTVPDFSYNGDGVRLTGVVAGSPAESAGLKEGDVLVRLDNDALEDLTGYAKMLRAMKPGDRVSLTYRRDGKEHTAQIEVVAR